jgi:hypothetical protein
MENKASHDAWLAGFEGGISICGVADANVQPDLALSMLHFFLLSLDKTADL